MVVTGGPEELAGYKGPTGRLLANGFRLTEAFALAASEAGWHLLFMAWRILAADDGYSGTPSKQLGQRLVGSAASLGNAGDSLQKGSPLTFVGPGVRRKPSSSLLVAPGLVSLSAKKTLEESLTLYLSFAF